MTFKKGNECWNNQKSIGSRFKRKHKEWTPENEEDGWIDHYGRFRVYLPSHLRADKRGYVYRSIVHYEYFNKTTIPEGYDVHHKDGNKQNDSKENLELIKHSEHGKLHNPLDFSKRVEKRCNYCNEKFYILKCKLKESSTRGKYCSLICRRDGGWKNGKK